MNKKGKATKLSAKVEEKTKAKKVEEEEDSELEIDSDSEEEVPKAALAGKRAKPEVKKAPAKNVPAKKEQPKNKKPPESEEEEEEENEVEGEEEESDKEAENGKEESDKEEAEESKEEEAEDNAEEEEEEKSAEEQKESGAEEGETEMFVGNLPFSATEDDISSFFSHYGEVAGVKILKRNDRPSGKAFVQFATHEGALKAKDADGQDFSGRKIEVRFASEPAPERAPRQSFNQGGYGQGYDQQRAPRQPRNDENTIFIGGLSYQSTKDSVAELFGACGNITAVRVATDQEGNPRGFAHVEFDSSDAVQEAIKLTGTELDGRTIRVDVAGNKGAQSSGGFRGGQRGGRGFGGRGRGDFRGGDFRGRGRGRGRGNDMPNRNKGMIQEFQGKRTKL